MKRTDNISLKLVFADRFNRLLDEHNFPSKGDGRVMAVANEYGITQGSAQKWMAGATLPEIDKIVGIAQIFGVTVDSLLGLDSIKGRVAGGPSGLLNRYVLMNKLDDLHPISSLNTEDICALPDGVIAGFQGSQHGDLVSLFLTTSSMSPTFKPGTTLIANRSVQFIQTTLDAVTKECEPVCIVRDGNQYLVRRIIVRGDEWLFSCDHPSYERETFNEKSILAIIVGTIGSI